MSSQDFTLLAKMALTMPSGMSKECKQYWIDRPKKLQQFQQGLRDFESKVIYPTPITAHLKGETFAPADFLLNDPRIDLAHGMRDFVMFRGGVPGTQVSFLDMHIRYILTKTEAANSVIRGELPEKHVFEYDALYLITLVANILRHQFEYGHTMALIPKATNLLYATCDDNHMVIVFDWQVDGTWKVWDLMYRNDTVWGPTTRVFLPSSEE